MDRRPGAPVPRRNTLDPTAQPYYPPMFPGLSPSNYGFGSGRIGFNPLGDFRAPRPDLPVLPSTGSLWGDVQQTPGVGLVPGLGTAATWSDSGRWGRGLNVGMDAIDIGTAGLARFGTTPLRAGVRGLGRFIGQMPDAPNPTFRTTTRNPEQEYYDMVNLANLNHQAKVTESLEKISPAFTGDPFYTLYGRQHNLNSPFWDTLVPPQSALDINPKTGLGLSGREVVQQGFFNLNAPSGPIPRYLGFGHAQEIPIGTNPPNQITIIGSPQQQTARSAAGIEKEAWERAQALEAELQNRPGVPADLLSSIPSPFQLPSQPFTTAVRAVTNTQNESLPSNWLQEEDFTGGI